MASQGHKGVWRPIASVVPPDRSARLGDRPSTRPFVWSVPAVSFSITLALIDLAGTACLLLWGVHMVQTGMRRALGARLRGALGRALGNRISAFLAGLGVTAVLQSSTATGLMAAGFAAEGLVALSPALAVMLGANVGTTLIVQVLSFDMTVVAPILILAGLVLFRNARAAPKDIGRVLIGLGLVLMALHQFLSLLGPLTADPMARDVLARLSRHIVFIVLVSGVLAWAAHSSIAIVLLAMSLTVNHVMPATAAIAMALGANLGSAVNPVLEGQSRGHAAGRRLTIGNLLNRLIGVAAVLAAFPFFGSDMASLGASPERAVANFHTVFNLVLALLFLPATPLIAKLLERWLPARPDQEQPGAPLYLDPAARETPSLALGVAMREALRLADGLEEMLRGLKAALAGGDRQQIQGVKRLDDVLDRLTTAIKAYVISIPVEQLTEADGQQAARILAFSTNFEQAGDLVDRNLLGIAARRLKRGVSFSPEGVADLAAHVDRLIATTRTAAAVFMSGDDRAAHALAEEKAVFREMEENAVAAHFQRLRSGNIETVETSALHLDALRDLKTVNAHLVEAAAYPILRQRGELLPSRVRKLTG
jgi:phosphate:Na+ symporter